MGRAGKAVVAVGIAALVGCASGEDEGPRYRDEDGQFSMIALSGWTQTHERDAVVFYGPATDGLSETSIAIRSVPRTGQGAVTGSAATVTAATKTAVSGLPGATLRGEFSVAHDEMTGMQFEVTFSPPKAGGQRYDRSHVVLIGERGGRVFHILHTAPEGTLEHTARLFEQIVDSFREEA